MIKLNHSIVPHNPFIWYREQQLCCPFELIQQTDQSNFNKIANKLGASYTISFNTEPTEFFIIVQRNILTNVNLYICNHSYAFYKENPTVKQIPPDYQKVFKYTTINCPVNILKYKTNLQDLKLVETGPVHIHDEAFSPPGVFKFRVANNKVNAFVSVNVDCKGAPGGAPNVEPGRGAPNCLCLFIIVNEIDGTNNNIIKEIIDTIKN